MKRLQAQRMNLSAIAGMGSLSLLLGAFGFQYIGELTPCALCILQRWPHALALCLATLNLKLDRAWVSLLGAAAASSSAGIAVFHTGVERGFWQGMKSCAGSIDITQMSAEDALEMIMQASVAKCDEVAWAFAGLSMASWNAILSIALAALWVLEMRRQMSKKTSEV